MLKPMKLSDFIAPISRYSSVLNYSNIEVMVGDPLLDNFGIDTTICDWLNNFIDIRLHDYLTLDFHFIPMELTEDVASDFNKILTALGMAIQRRSDILHLFSIANNKVTFADLSPSMTDNLSTTTNESGSGETTKTYGKVINKASNSMGENAPIDAVIDSISSPNVKTKGIDVDTHSGSDGESVSDSREKSITANRSVMSPENYEKFLEILREFNLPTMIDDLIRRFIWEYNRTL